VIQVVVEAINSDSVIDSGDGGEIVAVKVYW
jgi:hypothetical protein